MGKATLHFPKDFKWGTATAAHQVEGNNTRNQWWEYEQNPTNIVNGDSSGIACDWWNNAESDFDRMVDLGLNAHRLSIEWSRVEPNENRFDDAALERYRNMLLGLRQRGIEPMVTLHHFTHPMWLDQRGGWEDEHTVVPAFTRFVQKVVRALGDLCDLWCTINEPNVYAVMGYLAQRMPPARLPDLAMTLKIIRNMIVAHAAAYEKIHEIQKLARVGFAHNMRVIQAMRKNHPLDNIAARIQDALFNNAVLNAAINGSWGALLSRRLPSAKKLKGTLDWIGLNYYTRHLTRFDRSMDSAGYGTVEDHPGAMMSDFNYGEIYPQGLMKLLRRLNKTKLPIYITENGLPDADDDQRPAFIITHLREIWKAIQYCYDVRGYYHWTLTDNFEWSEGWRMKFGLFAMNPKTQERSLRPSGALYRDIVKSKTITTEMVEQYAPQILGEVFP
jgi:beta-glucosidase